MKKQSKAPSSAGEGQRRYHGEHIGTVVSVQDPKRLMRVQVRVKDIFDDVPDADLPWATYKLPIGSRVNDGLFRPVHVGDYVWCDFPHDGDSRFPRITGSVHFCPETIPNLPHEAFSGPEKYQHKRTGPQVVPSETGYHRDVVYSQHGVLLEIVDGTGEVRLTQKKSGSSVEIDRDGNITAHSENNLYGSSVNDTQVDVGKALKANVETNCIFSVGGDMVIECGGKFVVQAATIHLN